MVYELTEEDKNSIKNAVSMLKEPRGLTEEENKEETARIAKIISMSPEKVEEYIEAVCAELEKEISKAFNENLLQMVEEEQKH